MLNVILTTRLLTFNQIHNSIKTFYKQDLLSKKLMIMNNYPSWGLCLNLDIRTNKYVELHDKPFASDIKAQTDGIKDSQYAVAVMPHSDETPTDWLSSRLSLLMESGASIVHDGNGYYVAKKVIIPQPFVYESSVDEIIMLCNINHDLIVEH